MTTRESTITLPDELAREARTRGLLTAEHGASLSGTGLCGRRGDRERRRPSAPIGQLR